MGISISSDKCGGGGEGKEMHVNLPIAPEEAFSFTSSMLLGKKSNWRSFLKKRLDEIGGVACIFVCDQQLSGGGGALSVGLRSCHF